ncbi:MAG: MFS transporter [Clostridia bacterium]|nr:MFS transporter [Clostridia bacterium]
MKQSNAPIGKQITLYYLFNFLIRFMIYFPVFVVFLQSVDLNNTQIMIILSVYNAAVIIGEVPTGVFADRFSRKGSVIIGCILQGASIFLMVVLKDYYSFIILEAIFGIGTTFQSGAITSLFYDYLKGENLEESFVKYESKKWGFVFISQGIASILGGIIANFNIDLTLILTGIIFVLSVFVIAFFKEPTLHVRTDEGYAAHTKNTFLFIIKNNVTLPILVINGLTQMLFFTTLWLYQPYFKAVGIHISLFGVIYCVMNVFIAIGGFISPKVNMEKTRSRPLVIYCVGTFIPIFLMGIVHSYISVTFTFVMLFCMGLTNTWIQKSWEGEISSPQRATASSINNCIASLFFALIAPFIGLIGDNYGIFSAFIFSAALYAFLLLIFVATYVLKLNKKKTHTNVTPIK